MAKTEPKIIGIDPSLAATGITFWDGHTGTVRDRKLKGDKRLILLYATVRAVSGPADFCVIEDLPSHAMSAGITGRAQGVVRLALQKQDVPYVALPAATLKRAAVGKGNAKKDQMMQAVLDALGTEPSQDQERDPFDDNQADAFWLRECGRELMGLDNHLADPAALDKYREDPLVVALREVWA